VRLGGRRRGIGRQRRKLGVRRRGELEARDGARPTLATAAHAELAALAPDPAPAPAEAHAW